MKYLFYRLIAVAMCLHVLACPSSALEGDVTGVVPEGEPFLALHKSHVGTVSFMRFEAFREGSNVQYSVIAPGDAWGDPSKRSFTNVLRYTNLVATNPFTGKVFSDRAQFTVKDIRGVRYFGFAGAGASPGGGPGVEPDDDDFINFGKWEMVLRGEGSRTFILPVQGTNIGWDVPQFFESDPVKKHRRFKVVCSGDVDTDGFPDIVTQHGRKVRCYLNGFLTDYEGVSQTDRLPESRSWVSLTLPIALLPDKKNKVVAVTDGLDYSGGTNIVHGYDNLPDLVLRFNREIRFMAGIGTEFPQFSGPLMNKENIPPTYRFVGSWVTGPSPLKDVTIERWTTDDDGNIIQGGSNFISTFAVVWPDIVFQGGTRKRDLRVLRYCDKPSALRTFFTNDLNNGLATYVRVPPDVRVLGPR